MKLETKLNKKKNKTKREKTAKTVCISQFYFHFIFFNTKTTDQEIKKCV